MQLEGLQYGFLIAISGTAGGTLRLHSGVVVRFEIAWDALNDVFASSKARMEVLEEWSASASMSTSFSCLQSKTQKISLIFSCNQNLHLFHSGENILAQIELPSVCHPH